VNDLAVTLLTLGDPDTMTGGYLYHRRVADRAPAYGARIRFVSVPTWPFPLPALAGPRVVAKIRRQRPDVLLVDSIAAAFLAPWLRRVRPPMVAILHQPPGGIDHGGLRRRVQAALDRATYRRAAAMIVASADLGETMRRAGVDPGSLRVVAPGRDPAGTPVPPGSDLRGGRRVAILSVGNWVVRKGLLDLLAAVAALPADAATLHLVGDPGDPDSPYRARVQSRIASPELRDRVVVHGRRTPGEVVGLYQAADVFALASLREPYGTVYSEAMAEGLPVVGWDAGNLPHLARNGVEGIAVPPGDRAALTEALRSLAYDDDRRAALAAAAKERATTFPTWDDTTRHLVAELRAVALSKGRQA
jgi:glycosyltransferase involved in cell wall biosynthesis